MRVRCKLYTTMKCKLHSLFVLLCLCTSTVGWEVGWVVGKLESNAKLNSKFKVEVEVKVGVELGKIGPIAVAILQFCILQC